MIIKNLFEKQIIILMELNNVKRVLYASPPIQKLHPHGNIIS